MRNLIIVFAISIFATSTAFAEKAALVKLIKGEAHVLSGGKQIQLKADDWIDGGAVVKTSPKSFVKLVFIDKSQMNVGPSSEIKIEKFHNKDAGVIDLVRGKIRSQVTKDYLQIKGKDRSKLFIKTPNAVMGIRGTDFMISTNGKNTAAILFEGEVVFNRLNDRNLTDTAKLDDIVDRGVRMYPGEFSAVGESGAPTVPALLNVHQRERLEKNGNFEKNSSVSTAKATKSIVPAGLAGNVVSSKPAIEVSKAERNDQRASHNPDSFMKEGNVKPVNGSFVHIDSATIIAPGKDALFDENSNTYIASDKAGTVSSDGSYNPPKGITINADGGFIISAGAGASNAPQRVSSSSLPISSVNQNPLDQSQKLNIQIGDIVNDVKSDIVKNDDPNSVSRPGTSPDSSSGGTTDPTAPGSNGNPITGDGGIIDGATGAIAPVVDPITAPIKRLGDRLLGN